jgi:drug/metabolite transporter (DMT)-like permease
MTGIVVMLVLGAALMHATWNAILHSDADRLWSMVVMCMVSATCALPFALLLPAPSPASWPFIAASAAVQIVYCLFLVRSYRDAELSQIYPIARGSAPFMVAIGAALFAHERLGAVPLIGIACVCLGVISLARGKDRADPLAVTIAVSTGLLIAGYTLMDGMGARLSQNSSAYTAWLFVCQGAPMPVIYMLMRGRLNIPMTRQTLATVFGGFISALAYGAVILAMTLTPMGAVAALREVSILFAVLIGRIFLNERGSPARLAAGAVIAVGAGCLALGR